MKPLFNWLKRFFAKRPSGRSTIPLQVEALEPRWVPATTGVTKVAALDFDGVDLNASELRAGGWIGIKHSSLAGFHSLFDASRPWLDVNSDGSVNRTDANLAIDTIMAKVRTDFAPYRLNVLQMDQDAAQGRLTDSTIGDVSVIITGDKSQDFMTPVDRLGLAPWTDPGNAGDQIVFAFAGGSVDYFSGNRDQWFNQLARTISHEMGHAFGLDHDSADPATSDTDAISHSIMSTAERDWSRDFVFEDRDFHTQDGAQNAHRYLLREDILGRSENTYLAVLRPGELTISGNSAKNNIQVYETSPTTWLVIVDGQATYVDRQSRDVDSLNPFAAGLTSIRILGEEGDDHLYVSPQFTAPATIHGGAGQDTLYGGLGNDRLWGGDGDDYIHSRDGDDRLNGNEGDDFLIAGLGNDLLDGGGGRDYLSGQEGYDQLFGLEGDDNLGDGVDGNADSLRR